MTFINLNYLPYIIIGFLFFLLVSLFYNYKYFSWIKTYWFFEQTRRNKISSFLYYVSIMGLMISLLDLRGPEKKIKGNLPDQRTIIMIDTSLSMLTEDVKPNRFSKAIQLARHFVKNSAGHQLSLVVFSDTQKRLLPFTDDIDLVDSRLAALEKTNTVLGGSNISQAVTETVGYFESDSTDDKNIAGNILIFTDGEDGYDKINLSLGNNINLAVVGVGTARGGTIPLRFEDGAFKGYKQVGSEQVISKINEEFIKSLGKNVSNFNYWIVNSYSLPTEEVLNFFRATYKKSNSMGDIRIRPVYSHLILIPSIILYILSVVFGRFNTFKRVGIFILLNLLMFKSNNLEAQEKMKEIQHDLEKIKSGRATHKETLKVAEKMLRGKDAKSAQELYSEYLNKNEDPEEVKFNYVTSMLAQGKIKEASALVSDLLSKSKNEALKEKLRNNLLVSLNVDKNKSSKSGNSQDDKSGNSDKNEGNDKKDKNEKQGAQNKSGANDDKKNSNGNDQQKDSKQGNQSSSNQKSNQDKKEQEDVVDNKKKLGKDKSEKDDKKNSKESDEKNKKDGSEGNEDEKENGPQSLEEKEKKIEQQRKMVKVPGMIKQILNDDRELQKKLLDTSTREKGELKPKNDW